MKTQVMLSNGVKNHRKVKFSALLVLICTGAALPSVADGLRVSFGVSSCGSTFSIGYAGPRAAACVPRHQAVSRCMPPPPRGVPARPFGHYETRIERVWVDGCWRRTVCRDGRIIHHWTPGYWTERTVRVWVHH